MSDYTITFPWILIIICLWWQGTLSVNTGDNWDDIGRLDKEKMIALSLELLIDAKVKERQIYAVRENHNGMLAYEIGLVIGKIRERYKRMNDIYREAFDRKTNRTNLNPPGVRDFKAIHWVLSMELMHSLEVDIDKLVHVLELIPKSALGAPSKAMYASLLPSESPPMPSPLPRMLRTGNDTSKESSFNMSSLPFMLGADNDTSKFAESSTMRFKSQDELKQHYREKYNVKSGHNTNWTLDEYYGIV